MASASDLHAAVDDANELHRLISAGGDVESRDDWNCTPLFHAVLVGNLESVEVLIRAGANVNAVAGEPGCNILTSSSLSLAMQCRHLMDRAKYDPIVKALEAAGATI